MKYVASITICMFLILLIVFSEMSMAEIRSAKDGKPIVYIPISPDEIKAIAEECVKENPEHTQQMIFDYYMKHKGIESKYGKGLPPLPDLEELSRNYSKYEDLVNQYREANKNKVRLGEPFRVYWVDIEKLKTSSLDETDLSSLIAPINEWILPVIIEDEYAGEVFVEYLEGKWQVTGGRYGSGGIAEFYSMSEEFKPTKDKNKFVSVGPIIQFIAVEKDDKYKIFIPHKGKEEMMRLDKTYKDSNGLYDPLPILEKIKNMAMKGTRPPISQ